eukprot:234204-Prymnesium_polylepis.1
MCETGFNAGHSAANYLLANYFGNDVSYIGFDLGEHGYAHRAAEYLAALFGPRRVRVVWGESNRTLREFRAQHPTTACDGAMVDGLHTFQGALDDLLAFAALTHNGSRIAIDDADQPEVKEAWSQVLRCGLVQELGYVRPPGKSFAVGRYRPRAANSDAVILRRCAKARWNRPYEAIRKRATPLRLAANSPRS